MRLIGEGDVHIAEAVLGELQAQLCGPWWPANRPDRSWRKLCPACAAAGVRPPITRLLVISLGSAGSSFWAVGDVDSSVQATLFSNDIGQLLSGANW